MCSLGVVRVSHRRLPLVNVCQGNTGARPGRAPDPDGVGGGTATVQSSSVGQFPFAEVSAVAARGAGTFDAMVNPEASVSADHPTNPKRRGKRVRRSAATADRGYVLAGLARAS
jgi:hypothetical protein